MTELPADTQDIHRRNEVVQKDKQIKSIKLEDVVEKRRLDQALNAKEFAVLAGISYSTAREWFHAPGFPVFRGVVFWQDFVQWRNIGNGLQSAAPVLDANAHLVTPKLSESPNLPQRAMRILRENS